jgi:hypothetical protein
MVHTAIIAQAYHVIAERIRFIDCIYRFRRHQILPAEVRATNLSFTPFVN